MASELDTLKNVVMNVINGGNPAATLVKQAQDAVKSVIAEAKHMAEMTVIITPQEAQLAGEIAQLEVNKATKEAEKLVKENAVMVIDEAIAAQNKILELEKKAEAERKKIRDRQAAKAKARGEQVPETSEDDNKSRKLKEAVDEQQKQSDSLHKDIDNIQHEIDDINNQIKEKQKTVTLLLAQLSPAASLAASQQKLSQAQSKVNSATTPEAKEAAQQELEDAQQEESAMQAISDDHDTAVGNKETVNEPKMMQLQAEYQIMDAGVKTIQNLTTNLVALLGPSGLFTVPTTLVTGQAAGVANTIYSTLFGNVLYPYGYFIIATVKAASVRFLALAQELEYTPTTEMAIINMIKPTETAFKAAMTAYAPAGGTLM